MKIVGIDVGKKGAVAVLDLDSGEYIKKEQLSFFDSMSEIYTYFVKLFRELNDEIIVVIGEAFGQRVVVKKHSKFYGVIEMACELSKTELYYVSDSTARAAVLGKGNGRKKEMVKEFFNEPDQDEADAMLFCRYFVDWVYDGK